MALKTKPLELVREDIPTAVGADGQVRINLNTSPELREAWKKAARARHMSVTTLIHLSVSAYLGEDAILIQDS